MKKMRLDLETLSVETFDATPREGRARGTVRALSGFTKGESWRCPSQGCTLYVGSCASSCDYAQCGDCYIVTEGATCLPHHCEP